MALENAVTSKDDAIRTLAFRAISVCVKHYEHAFTAQTTIIQTLHHLDHMSVVLADLVAEVTLKYDFLPLGDAILTYRFSLIFLHVLEK